MHFTQFIARMPSTTTGQGLTTSDLGSPDEQLVQEQFSTYVRHLLSLGLTGTILPADGEFPDGHFVEDTAVFIPECAIITHPGAPSRAGEVASITPIAARFRELKIMVKGGRLDGGDVLLIDKQFFIGLTNRTDEAGISEFAAFVEPFGYQVTSIEVAAGLHLKSIVNYVGRNSITVSEQGARHPAFAPYRHLIVLPEEEYAGNTLWINDHLITPSGFPDTLAKLKTLGLPIIEMNTSEFRKMDGGLTCLSLRF